MEEMMNDCPRCSAQVDADDRFCRACGQLLQDQVIKWQHRRGPVLVLLFFVLGPLGLRLLWTSPAFSTRERILFTIASIMELMLILTLMVRAYVGFLLDVAGLDQM